MSVDLGDYLSAVYEAESFHLISNQYNKDEVNLGAFEIESGEYAFYEWLDKECDRGVSF